MVLIDNVIKSARPKLYDKIKKEVLLFKDKYIGDRDKIIQDDIFRIIEEIPELELILFPIKDDELSGFICAYKGELFTYINTYQPREKQIFAAAHELYHFARAKFSDEEAFQTNFRELLKSEDLEEKQLANDIEIEDAKANLFAALFLVPKKLLKEELDYYGVKTEEELDKLELIKLMDTFAVPYKTIVLRLYEIEFITREKAEKLLEIPDRDPGEGILKLINLHQIADRWQQRTREVKPGSLRPLIHENENLELLPLRRINKDKEFIEKFEKND